jgi:hypothetical protein
VTALREEYNSQCALKGAYPTKRSDHRLRESRLERRAGLNPRFKAKGIQPRRRRSRPCARGCRQTVSGEKAGAARREQVRTVEAELASLRHEPWPGAAQQQASGKISRWRIEPTKSLKIGSPAHAQLSRPPARPERILDSIAATPHQELEMELQHAH